MGFGSYDESEQKHQEMDTEEDEDAAINVHEHDHQGTVSVESDASTDALLGQLKEIKDKEEQEDE